MPNPMLHPTKPKYRTIHSDVCVEKEHRDSADFFLFSSVPSKTRKRARNIYWQLSRADNHAITDDSIQTIVVNNEPHAIVTRLRDDANYLYTNFFKPFKQVGHKNSKKLLDTIKKQLMQKYPNLTEINFEIKSYNIKEYDNPSGYKVHILIVNNKLSQAVVLLFENEFGTTIFKRV